MVEHEKNNFSEITKVDASGGFELRARVARHQTRYRLRYAAGKARQLKLPITAGAFFSLNTSLNTTRVPTSFKILIRSTGAPSKKMLILPVKAKFIIEVTISILKMKTSGGLFQVK